jgi:hypothetical protein
MPKDKKKAVCGLLNNAFFKQIHKKPGMLKPDQLPARTMEERWTSLVN